eukprot:53951_1
MDPYSAILSWAMKEHSLKRVYGIKSNPKKKDKNEKKSNDFVMVVGFDRTGTTSIQVALSQLGFRCYSFNDAYRNDKDKDIWIDLLQQKLDKFKQLNNLSTSSPAYTDWNVKTMVKYNWDKMFTHEYDGCCGSPSNAFFLEIKAHYHGRFKIILSIKDNGETWYKSMLNTWYKYMKYLSSYIFRISIKYNKNYKFIRLIYLVMLKIDINDYKKQQIYVKQKYGEWKKFVKNSVYPESRLLIYNCREGYKPLCKFLKKKIPKSKFPHKAKQEEFRTLFASAQHAQKVAVNLFIVIGIIIAFLIRYFYILK